MKIKGFKVSESRFGRVYTRDYIVVRRNAGRWWEVWAGDVKVVHCDRRHRAFALARHWERADRPLHEGGFFMR